MVVATLKHSTKGLTPMPFRDRAHAGQELAKRLSEFRAQRPIIIALPRRGVPVGYEVARALAAPLDVLIARKLGQAHETPQEFQCSAENIERELRRYVPIASIAWL
jgi:predicted phosphoribosyltransferase